MNERTSSDRTPTVDEIEDLFVNNADIDGLRAHLNRFNPIRTMGMERMEIRHSAILRWLLDPQETHGLGTDFLSSFLAEALRGRRTKEGPNALDIIRADLGDAEVRREWRSIDLLVLSPSNGWAFVIENKFESRQHGDQLRRYLELAENAFGGGDDRLHVKGIFLTLYGEEPEDDRYAPILYETICELLPPLIDARAHPLSPEVDVFIRHYLEIITEATGMTDERKEMERLAKQLYRDHKRVLDFVVEHGTTTDFAVAAESVFGEGNEYHDKIEAGGLQMIFGSLTNDTVSFMPRSWVEALGGYESEWENCDDWWMGYPLIVWISLLNIKDDGSGRIGLYAEVGRLENHEVRAGIIHEIERIAAERSLSNIKFQRSAADEGKKYSKFLKGNIANVDDVQDHEKIAKAIRSLLLRFQKEFEAVASILPQFEKHGKN